MKNWQAAEATIILDTADKFALGNNSMASNKDYNPNYRCNAARGNEDMTDERGQCTRIETQRGIRRQESAKRKKRAWFPSPETIEFLEKVVDRRGKR